MRKTVLLLVSLVFVLFSIIFNVLILLGTTFDVELTETEALYEKMAGDPYSITFNDLNKVDDHFVLMIGYYDSYTVYVNKFNPYIEYFVENNVLNYDLIKDIVNNEKIVWIDFQPINVLYLESDIPSILNIDLLLSENKVSSTSIKDYFYVSLADLLLSSSLAFMLIIFFYQAIKDDTINLKKNKVKVILYGILGCTIIMLVDYILTLIINYFDLASISANQISIERALFSKGMIFMALSSVIVAPIFEELLFRKAAFKIIKNDKIALIVSSVIFGSLHLFFETNLVIALLQSISYIGSGFILGAIYLRTKKNIYAPIIAHFLNNLILLVLILI